ncbi:circadian clock protein KaiB [Acuticoccus sp. M5D2P5]|uniref:circadian clock protein KaiB n=1 Tax=Acuticoccus kalidii TaxID=2910977 RepID=UPI001F236EC7|nr:circadian clock protein KaiB [Acuticoccus kalidii]MCF3933022.1 circadian clock protein KaiB [Acuticoccus kalidii]
MSYRLRLYVTGRTAHSQRAIRNLQEICENELRDRYQIEVIDVLENPRLAENEKIMATPTLVRRLPEPVRKIIGDLSDREKVLLGLDIVPAPIHDPERGVE